MNMVISKLLLAGGIWGVADKIFYIKHFCSKDVCMTIYFLKEERLAHRLMASVSSHHPYSPTLGGHNLHFTPKS